MNFIDIAHAQEEVATEAHTEVAHEDTGVLGSLGISGPLFAAQLLNFAIVASILWFLILKPLTKKMQERAKLIDDSLENAKKVEENLRTSEQKYQERIDLAKVEASKILDKAAADTEQVTLAMKQKAKSEIDLLVDQAKRNIAIEKDEMVAALKKENANIIIAALEKILSEKMTGEKDKQMIEEMVKKIK